MPTNLNALIRYKTIDACLRNRFIECTIDYLIDSCSQALTEYRGRNAQVSERTIRDDLRVMKSDILGFNAPIETEGSRYFYSDTEYSIFTTPLKELELLKQVLEMLILERQNIITTEVDALILKLSKLTDVALPKELMDDMEKDMGEPELEEPDSLAYNIVEEPGASIFVAYRISYAAPRIMPGRLTSFLLLSERVDSRYWS